MRKNLVSILFVFISITIAALVSTAQAQMCGCMGEKGESMQEGGMMGGMGHQGMGMMPGMDGMKGGEMMRDDHHAMWKNLMDLGLDAQQKDALEALRSKTMKDMIRKKADEQIADLEIKDLLDKNPVDMKAVETLVKKKESLRAEMFIAHIKAREEMKSVLTPDQWKRLKEMMETGHRGGCGMKGGNEEHKAMPMHDNKMD